MKVSNIDQKGMETCDAWQNPAPVAPFVSTVSFRKSGACNLAGISLKALLASARHTTDVGRYLHPCTAGGQTFIIEMLSAALEGSNETENDENMPPLE